MGVILLLILVMLVVGFLPYLVGGDLDSDPGKFMFGFIIFCIVGLMLVIGVMLSNNDKDKEDTPVLKTNTGSVTGGMLCR